MTRTKTIILLFLAFSACDAELTPDTFDPRQGTMELVCEDTRCWTTTSSWDSWAAATTPEIIDQAELAGAWKPLVDPLVGDQCWSLAGTDGHVCIVEFEGVFLLGRPSEELLLKPAGLGCDYQGAWETTRSFDDYCMGIVDGVAFVIDENPWP